MNGSASTTAADGANPTSSGQPSKSHESSGRRVADSAAVRSGPTRPAHRLTAGQLLDLGARADHRLGGAADQAQRVEQGVDGGHDVLERAGVGPGDGHDHQVRTFADLLQDGTDRPRRAAWLVTGWRERALANATGAHAPDGANRMSSERR